MQQIHEQLYQIFKSYRKNIDSNLLYSYRKSNIGGFLDKGYYFPGDDNTIAVSFWSGLNIRTRLPDICIIIYRNGQIFLEVSLDNLAVKNEFIEQHILPLFPFEEKEQRNRVSQFNLGTTDNLEEVIFNFLKNEKKLIDKTVQDNSFLIFKGNTNIRDIIGFIDTNSFKADERKIEKYRKDFIRSEEFENSQKSKEKPIHLISFQVKNFAIIKNAEFSALPKDNRWIFLTGENSSGKTLILRSIALALARGIIPEKYSKQHLDEPKIRMVLKKRSGEIDVYNRNGNNDDAKYAKTPLVMGLAAYGIFRHEVKYRIENDPLSKYGSLDSILSDEKIVSLLNFNQILQEWGKNNKEYDRFEKRKYFLASTLIEIVPNLVDIHFNKGIRRINAEYFIENGENGPMRLDYSQLSSGTRSIISLVADIFIRFYNQQPKIDDPSEFRGIVLIDEIDLHLHPIGQRDLVMNLAKIFPNIQFIVSTHSPIPILGAPEKSVILTVKKEAEKGIYVERWDDKIPVKKLLPNALLTSPIFDLNDILPLSKSLSEIRTEDNFDEAFFNYMLQKKINDLKKIIE